MNKYLEKIALMSAPGKALARKVASGLEGKSIQDINGLYNKTTALNSKKFRGVLSTGEKDRVISGVTRLAKSSPDTSILTSGEALKSTRVGARLAKFKANH